ncbi:MAG TPA: hypothetical protein DCR55_11815, partial [Lentisphaeria bacterium]|nr:hypothetical protein [Lentisphaeria bacterium]
DRSYGIHVAQLAGLPNPVIARAKEVLTNLEGDDSGSTNRQPRLARRRPSEVVREHPTLFEL